jgi:Transposase DDE domain
MAGISASQCKFLMILLSTIALLRGKMNFRNLSRYSPICEKTYSRQFASPFAFPTFNQHLLAQLPASVCICAALDASFISKSGHQTYGRDFFYNSIHNKAEKGLEISVLSVIDSQAHTAFTISARQTPPIADIRALLHTDPTSEAEENRIDFYLHHLKQDCQYLPLSVRYLLTDGNYTKPRFIDGVVAAGLQQIGKLRHDARMRYLYDGPQKSRGRKRAFDGEVDLNDLSRMEYAGEVDTDIFLYSAVVNVISLKRNVRIAILVNKADPEKPKYVILFCTDLTIDPKLIYQYYKSRFQIEFIFRDAKQFTGLCDCQARDKDRLNFHFNASLTTLNLAKIEARIAWNSNVPFSFSMSSVKCRQFNAHLLDTIISMLDLDPDLIKNNPQYRNLLTYGAIHT